MTDAPANATPPTQDKEVADGKVLAILSYIIWIVALVVLIIRNNSFALYHAKQAMTLFLAWLVLFIPLMILNVIIGVALASVTRGVGACIMPIVMFGAGIGMLVLIILGIVNAANGVCKPLPVVGPFADKLFGSLQKKTA